MPVKYFEFGSIEARRFSKSNETHPNIQIGHNFQMDRLTEVNDREVKVDFRFSINYTGMGPMGSIKLEGFLVFESPEGKASELAQKWASEKKIPDNVMQEIFTVASRNCILEATIISRDVRLPPPIQMPQVKVGKGNIPPSSGIEVA
jgi:hypothetical protein